jgi:hypothetical protein
MDLPIFYEDKYYEPTQETLYDFGLGAIEGQSPKAYKSLFEPGGAEFDAMLNNITGDITERITEDMARRGSRGGAGAEAISKSVGDISTKLRWDDYLNTMNNQKWLLGTGLNTIGGVRTAGLDNQNQRNRYEMDKSKLQFMMEESEKDRAERKKATEGELWSDLLEAGISGIGSLVGMGMTGGMSGFLGGGGGLGSASGSFYNAFDYAKDSSGGYGDRLFDDYFTGAMTFGF